GRPPARGAPPPLSPRNPLPFHPEATPTRHKPDKQTDEHQNRRRVEPAVEHRPDDDRNQDRSGEIEADPCHIGHAGTRARWAHARAKCYWEPAAPNRRRSHGAGTRQRVCSSRSAATVDVSAAVATRTTARMRPWPKRVSPRLPRSALTA